MFVAGTSHVPGSKQACCIRNNLEPNDGSIFPARILTRVLHGFSNCGTRPNTGVPTTLNRHEAFVKKKIEMHKNVKI